MWALSSDGTFTVSGTGDMYNYSSGSTPREAYNDDITTVIMSDGVTGIGEDVFHGFCSITSLKISDSV